MTRQVTVLIVALVMAGAAVGARGQEPEESADETWVEDVAPPPPGEEDEQGKQDTPGPFSGDLWTDDCPNDGISVFGGPCRHGDECQMSCCKPCFPVWAHSTGAFASYLFLRPRYTEVAYAVPIDGAIVPPPDVPIQYGPAQTVDPNYDNGYRVGFNKCLNPCASIRATYWNYQSSAASSIVTDAPLVLRSMVSHPYTLATPSDFLEASATSSIDFQFADLDYRGLFHRGPNHALNYVVGVRYVHLHEDFGSLFVDNGTESVTSAVNFDGGGLRVGLEGDHVGRFGLTLYGRAAASFVGGQFRANYVQSQSFDPLVVDTDWRSGRLISILDLELGVGWTSRNQCVRLKAGYLVSGWFNAVKTVDFIEAVRGNDFTDLTGAFSFDGLTAGAEFRF